MASQVALVVKNPPANAGDIRYVGSIPGLERFPWRRAWKPTPVVLPGESHDREAWELQFIGLQRVRHNWSNLACTHMLEVIILTGGRIINNISTSILMNHIQYPIYFIFMLLKKIRFLATKVHFEQGKCSTVWNYLLEIIFSIKV